jgi:hypothetical protein
MALLLQNMQVFVAVLHSHLGRGGVLYLILSDKVTVVHGVSVVVPSTRFSF